MNKNIIATVAVVGVIAAIAVGAMAFKDDAKTNMPADMNMPTSQTDEKMTPSADMGMEKTNAVTYKGFAVVQKKITVKKGTTVTWTNEDDAKHDVTPDTETADFKATELFGKGETVSITFNTVGTFGYKCSPHPYMKGVVEVTE